MNRILILSCSFLMFFSCTSKPKFSYKDRKQDYLKARNCLLKNYSILFPSTVEPETKYIKANELQEWNFYKEMENLVKEESIEFIEIQRDSSISFYYKCPSRNDFRTERYCLMFINDDRLKEKLTSDVASVTRRDTGCYELMRIISLAN